MTGSEVSSGTWGQFASRGRTNLLAGAVSTPCGDLCAAEFLAFDSQARQILLCRYVEDAKNFCIVTALNRAAPHSEALEEHLPRQLALCSRCHIFASLVIEGGIAAVAVWQLGRHSEGDQEYSLAARLQIDGIAGARALEWHHGDKPPWLDTGGHLETGALFSGSSSSAVLAVLIAREVLITEVQSVGHGRWEALVCARLTMSFQGACLGWSQDGMHLLVGGKGQMTCFLWKADRSRGEGNSAREPQVRNVLCAGSCCEVHGVHNNAFVCRLDECGAGQPADLRLPDGRSVPGAPALRALVVEAENPQDAVQEHEPLRIAPERDLMSLQAISSLQVVPNRRCLVPLRWDCSGTQSLRLCCGSELEIHGEVVATSRSSDSYQNPGSGVVTAVGSFDGEARAQLWTLAPPHRWGRGSREWRTLGQVELAAGMAQSAQRARLAGLALWPGAPGKPQLHAILAIGPGAPPLGTPVRREHLHACCLAPLSQGISQAASFINTSVGSPAVSSHAGTRPEAARTEITANTRIAGAAIPKASSKPMASLTSTSTSTTSANATSQHHGGVQTRGMELLQGEAWKLPVINEHPVAQGAEHSALFQGINPLRGKDKSGDATNKTDGLQALAEEVMELRRDVTSALRSSGLQPSSQEKIGGLPAATPSPYVTSIATDVSELRAQFTTLLSHTAELRGEVSRLAGAVEKLASAATSATEAAAAAAAKLVDRLDTESPPVQTVSKGPEFQDRGVGPEEAPVPDVTTSCVSQAEDNVQQPDACHISPLSGEASDHHDADPLVCMDLPVCIDPPVCRGSSGIPVKEDPDDAPRVPAVSLAARDLKMEASKPPESHSCVCLTWRGVRAAAVKWLRPKKN